MRTGCFLVAIVMLAAACSPSAKSDVDPACFNRSSEQIGGPFKLTAHTGATVTQEDFKGRKSLVFFGFTHCPDVCPTTLADMAQVMRQLGADADRVQVLFVTVDPERDTQEALAQYVPAFDARFLGLRGDLEATRRVAKEFKVYFEKRPGATPGAYSVDHSAQTYVLDPQGRLRLFVRHGRIAEDLAPDLRVLLK